MVEYLKKPKAFLALAMVIVLAASFIIYFSTSKETATKEEGYEVQGVTISNDVLIYEDIENMAQGADVVVVGYFNKMVDTINMLRDPNNILNESPHGYEEGRIYDFKVDEVIAGEVDKNEIHVGLRYSYKYEFIDKQGAKKNIQVLNSLYKQPNSQQKYVLFLYKNEELDTYFVPFEPYRLVVNDDNTVGIDSALVDKSHRTDEVQIVKLEETREELHISNEVHGEIEDKITGKELSEIKKSIISNFKQKN